MEYKSNLSVVLHKAGDIRVEDTPLPAKPGVKEVTLKCNFCGICGTDTHLFHEGNIGDYFLKKPLIIGHEASATVVAVGPRVTRLSVGDRVTVEPAIPCNDCTHCREGNYNWCDVCNNSARGLPHTDGFLRRYFNHPADFCYKLPDHVSLEQGSLGEPMAVIVHAMKRSGITVGDKVLVCGAGTMGLLSALVAKAFGATEVCITDINERRLNLAKELGVDHSVLLCPEEASEKVAEKVKALLGGGANVCLECTGVESSVQMGLMATRNGGKLAAIGLGKPFIRIPYVSASLREIDIIGVCRFRNSFPLAVDLLRRLNVKPIVTNVFKLENVKEAFMSMEKGVGVKTVIQCSD